MVLDEPSNDVDTDMLAAMEDLLDSWPGTLIVVSHDRYLVERVTDQQYAIIDGRLRHVPGGVDEYLRLQETTAQTPVSASRSSDLMSQQSSSGAEEHAARKELAASERKLERLAGQSAKLQEKMATHDPSDYEGLTKLNEKLRAVQQESSEVEERWLELAEQLG